MIKYNYGQSVFFIKEYMIQNSNDKKLLEEVCASVCTIYAKLLPNSNLIF